MGTVTKFDMRSLLVTNDFPPKLGGIQSYLWELWKRIPGDDTSVITLAHEGDAAWDATQPWPVERISGRSLFPTPSLRTRVAAAIEQYQPDVVLLDPLALVAPIGPQLRKSWPDLVWAPILHGAEITVPRRTPGVAQVLRRVIRDADFVVAAGGYPLAEGERLAGQALRSLVVPPGVDTKVFSPLSDEDRRAMRARLGLPTAGPLVMGISRLVPRKGFDTLIRAAALVSTKVPGLVVAIGGAGRDEERLRKIADAVDVDVRFLGAIPEGDLPGAYACADVFAMLCRNRWLGLEQEGFGIVFMEAAAAGVPAIAGRSGGSHEAVADDETGIVVDRPTDLADVAEALHRLVTDRPHARQLGEQARARAVEAFDHDKLAARFLDELAEMVETCRAERAS